VRQVQNELLVIGNGPSLRDYEFSEFSGWKTLGMNAAYRFWNRIDWRPSYYCCLDDALVDTHKDAILDLISEGRVARFFLTARILEHFPALISDRRVRYLDEYVQHWHRVRGQRLGLNYSPHPAFLTSSPSMLTTGSYSIRYAATLGFTSVRLVGFDLSYQPLQQARSIGGTRLVMEDTPTENPNYFFDDYQKAGDHFNIANPDEHGRDLHLHAFNALRDDFVANEVPVRLLNASTRSKLFTDAVLPFLPLDSPQRPVACPDTDIVLLRVSSIESVENLFWLYCQPAHFPVLGDKSRPNVDLIISSPASQTKEFEKRVAMLQRRYPALSECFRDIRVGSPTRHGLAEEPFEGIERGVRRIDEDSAPISCDWLTQWVSMEEDANTVVDLPALPQSPTDVYKLRSTTPRLLFLKSPNMQDTLTRLRKEKPVMSLSRLLSTSVIDENRRDKHGSVFGKLFSFLTLGVLHGTDRS
jgi:hypothetical protein